MRPVDTVAHVLTLSVQEEQVLLTSVGCVLQAPWAQVLLCYRNDSSLTLCAPQITFIDQHLLNQKLYHSLFRLFFPSLHLWGIGLAKANVLIKQLGNHCYRLLCKSRV